MNRNDCRLSPAVMVIFVKCHLVLWGGGGGVEGLAICCLNFIRLKTESGRAKLTRTIYSQYGGCNALEKFM